MTHAGILTGRSSLAGLDWYWYRSGKGPTGHKFVDSVDGYIAEFLKSSRDNSVTPDISYAESIAIFKSKYVLLAYNR
ncbi:unnamed protein product, partial [Rotaria socialis]